MTNGDEHTAHTVVNMEVRQLLTAAAWLMLGSMLYTLGLQTGSFPQPLTAAQEREYLQRAAQGDLEARNVLIERNLRLVAHIMKKYYATTADQEDLISIGTIGLIKAVSTFDYTKGTRLATYAARCVENAILTPRRFRVSNRLQGSRCSDYCINQTASGDPYQVIGSRNTFSDGIVLFVGSGFH